MAAHIYVLFSLLVFAAGSGLCQAEAGFAESDSDATGAEKPPEQPPGPLADERSALLAERAALEKEQIRLAQRREALLHELQQFAIEKHELQKRKENLIERGAALKTRHLALINEAGEIKKLGDETTRLAARVKLVQKQARAKGEALVRLKAEIDGLISHGEASLARQRAADFRRSYSEYTSLYETSQTLVEEHRETSDGLIARTDEHQQQAEKLAEARRRHERDLNEYAAALDVWQRRYHEALDRTREVLVDSRRAAARAISLQKRIAAFNRRLQTVRTAGQPQPISEGAVVR